MCVHRNGYLWVSGENFDTGMPFLDPDKEIGVKESNSLTPISLHGTLFRQFEDVFC